MFENLNKNLPGGANMGGIPQFVLYARRTDIVSFPKPGTGTLTDAGSSTADIVMRAGNEFRRLYITDDTGELEFESVGEKDGKSWVIHLRMFHPGLNKKLLGFINLAKNGDIVILVPDSNGNYFLLGDADRSATYDGSPDSSGTGRETSARAGISMEFTYKTNNIFQVTGNVVESETIPAPIASNVIATGDDEDYAIFIENNPMVISAASVVGKTLVGSYVFSDPSGLSEFMSQFAWYIADDFNGTNRTKLSTISKSLLVLAQFEGKFLQFGVMPSNAISIGEEELSKYYHVAAAMPIHSAMQTMIQSPLSYNFKNTMVYSESSGVYEFVMNGSYENSAGSLTLELPLNPAMVVVGPSPQYARLVVEFEYLIDNSEFLLPLISALDYVEGVWTNITNNFSRAADNEITGQWVNVRAQISKTPDIGAEYADPFAGFSIKLTREGSTEPWSFKVRNVRAIYPY